MRNPMSRLCGGVLFAALVPLAAAQSVVTAKIDAARPSAPIHKWLLGGFMEPATTIVWAEMLYDRKFVFDINSKPDPPPAGNAFLRGRANRWKPIAADETVVMDARRAYASEHSPLIRLAGAEPHGIRQSGIALRSGKTYVGRIVLAADPGANVSVALVWGPNSGDRQTLPIQGLTGAWTTFPLKFTAQGSTDDGRVEIRGTGSGTFHIGAASLMPADHVEGYKPGMIRYLRQAGMSLARWPGGNFVSAYDWRHGIGDRDRRPSYVEPVWRRLETNDVGIDEFLTFCRLIGAEPYIAVNTGFGEAHSAAEELEYVNGSTETPLGKWRAANGHRDAYGVKIWGIGNEMYGPWQFGYMSLNQYWVKHNQVVKAMRQVDPGIQVIASSATIEEMSWCAIDQEQFSTSEWRARLTRKLPFEYGSHDDWTGGLLANSAAYIDYLGEHFYAYPDLHFDADSQRFAESGDPLELAVRRLPNKVAYKFEAWDEYLRRMPELQGTKIKFALDEWSARYRSVRTPPTGSNPFGGGMKTPLSNALTFHEMFRHSDRIDLSAYTGALRNVLTDATGDGVGLRPEGLVAKLFHDHLVGSLPVAVGGDSPQRQFRGTIGVDTSKVPSGSPTYPLDVFAALTPDRKVLILSVVNPTEKPQRLEWTITGVELGAGGKLFRLAGTSVDATNVAGQPPAVDIVESPASANPAGVALPPISISVFEFPVK